MLLDLLKAGGRLSAARIILASASPRRIALLQQAGLNVEVIPSAFPEDLDKLSFPSAAAYACENARRKALDVWHRLEGPAPHVLIGCDTVVAAGGRILEKPGSREEAIAMLTSLSNSSHHVVSGVCVLSSQPASSSPVEEVWSCSTEVHFAHLDQSIIEAYADTPEPYDKAGGYGIQAGAGAFVRRIDGCYFNVMGLPLHEVCAAIRRIALSFPTPEAVPAPDATSAPSAAAHAGGEAVPTAASATSGAAGVSTSTQ